MSIVKMLIPVRCFSCNYPISKHYLEYLEYKEKNKGKNLELFFKEKNIKKYCCSRMLLTHVDTHKIIKNKH